MIDQIEKIKRIDDNKILIEYRVLMVGTKQRVFNTIWEATGWIMQEWDNTKKKDC